MSTFCNNMLLVCTPVRRTEPDSVRHRTWSGCVLFVVSCFPRPGSTARLTLRDAWLPRHYGDSIVSSKPWSPNAPFRSYAGGARPRLKSRGLTAASSGLRALRSGLGLFAPIEPVPSCFCLLLVVFDISNSQIRKTPGESHSPIGPLRIWFAPRKWVLPLSPISHDFRRKGISRDLCSQRSLLACRTRRQVRSLFQAQVFESDADALHDEQRRHRGNRQSYSGLVSETRNHPHRTPATSKKNSGTSNTQRGLRLATRCATKCLVRRGCVCLFGDRHCVTVGDMIAWRWTFPASEGADSSAKNWTQLDCCDGLACEFLDNCVCRTYPRWVLSSVRLLPRDALQHLTSASASDDNESLPSQEHVKSRHGDTTRFLLVELPASQSLAVLIVGGRSATASLTPSLLWQKPSKHHRPQKRILTKCPRLFTTLQRKDSLRRSEKITELASSVAGSLAIEADSPTGSAPVIWQPSVASSISMSLGANRTPSRQMNLLRRPKGKLRPLRLRRWRQLQMQQASVLLVVGIEGRDARTLC